MTEVKHTSQEWYFDRHFVRALPKTRTGTPVDIARIYKGGKTEEEFNANAHLIAAAPDMYEALEESQAIMQRLVQDWPDRPPADLISQCAMNYCVVAKAKGEEK